MQFAASLIEKLASARRVAVLTGSGVSAESGIPTFRDAQLGIWARFRPEELATPGAFRRDPQRVWEWYAWRRTLISQAQPNPGHRALKEMATLFPEFTLMTQNIDGLHQRAGSRDVIELHGNINRTRCAEEGIVVAAWEETGQVPPRCPQCGGLLRPDVVWFEEELPADALQLAIQRSSACDVFISVGTSAVVYPAADLPVRALENGASLVEINPSPTPLSPKAHFAIAAPSAEVLPALVQQLKAARAER